jgi:hypothetical protein
MASFLSLIEGKEVLEVRGNKYMENTENPNGGLIELDMWDDKLGDLQREHRIGRENQEALFRKFVEESLPAKEHGEHGAAEAYFTDYHNAETFADIARRAGFAVKLIESGKHAPKPFVKVWLEEGSFTDFLASKGYKKKK